MNGDEFILPTKITASEGKRNILSDDAFFRGEFIWGKRREGGNFPGNCVGMEGQPPTLPLPSFFASCDGQRTTGKGGGAGEALKGTNFATLEKVREGGVFRLLH